MRPESLTSPDFEKGEVQHGQPRILPDGKTVLFTIGTGEGSHIGVEQRLRQAQKEGLIRSESLGLQIDEAVRAKVINRKEADALRNYHDKVSALLAVDDFAPEDLIRAKVQPADKPRKKAAKRKARPRKKVARKKKTSKA